MSALLERAKKVAHDNDLKNRAKQNLENERLAVLKADLENMKSLLMQELSALNGQKNSHGNFKIELTDGHNYDVIAFIWSESKMTSLRPVAWFKAKIVSGTCRYSDDSPLESYTDSCVWARIYSPKYTPVYNGTWDLAEERMYANGGRTESCTSVKDMPKFIEKVADILANWF